MRELPATYPDREWDASSKQWLSTEQSFASETRAAYSDNAEKWSPFWPVAYRWAVLFDKFTRTASEAVSAECRQLEKDLRALVAEQEEAKPLPEGPADEGAATDLDSMLDDVIG